MTQNPEIRQPGRRPSAEPTFGVHRADLDEPVRNYADNLHAQILELMEKLGVKSRAEFEAGIENGTLTDVETIERIFDLNHRLVKTVERNRIPEILDWEKAEIVDRIDLPRGVISVTELSNGNLALVYENRRVDILDKNPETGTRVLRHTSHKEEDLTCVGELSDGELVVGDEEGHVIWPDDEKLIRGIGKIRQIIPMGLNQDGNERLLVDGGNGMALVTKIEDDFKAKVFHDEFFMAKLTGGGFISILNPNRVRIWKQGPDGTFDIVGGFSYRLIPGEPLSQVTELSDGTIALLRGDGTIEFYKKKEGKEYERVAYADSYELGKNGLNTVSKKFLTPNGTLYFFDNDNNLCASEHRTKHEEAWIYAESLEKEQKTIPMDGYFNTRMSQLEDGRLMCIGFKKTDKSDRSPYLYRLFIIGDPSKKPS